MESLRRWQLIEEWYATCTVDCEWEQEYKRCAISDIN